MSRFGDFFANIGDHREYCRFLFVWKVFGIKTGCTSDAARLFRLRCQDGLSLGVVLVVNSVCNFATGNVSHHVSNGWSSNKVSRPISRPVDVTHVVNLSVAIISRHNAYGTGSRYVENTGWDLVDEFSSECTDSQLNAEHWFARIKKLYNRNRSFLCVSCLHKLFM